ncbi:MAG: NAD(P)/FAD-dependent oxidoreductase [Chloroflexi bacterium]|nr:NAD(P)/FAD-dependent oxidoreductase [Chloroflexota bacterium]
MEHQLADGAEYDVIIAGASFAGLAVAAPLRGKRVLLLDRKPVGTRPTSACGTTLQALQALGLEEAVQQIHQEVTLHTPYRSVTYPASHTQCVLDYALLCRLLQERGDAEFLQTPALGLEQGGVRTSQGIYRGRFLVDASGWRATLASSLRPGLVRADHLSVGIETVIPHRQEGLHFWLGISEKRAIDIGWVFPAGDVSHVGVARYARNRPLRGTLDRFLAERGLECGEVYGGAIPAALRPATIGDLFLVGDAAGHCLPTTGEGIRAALFFGTHLGQLLNDTLEGRMTPAAARALYREMVEQRRRAYGWLRGLQGLVTRTPLPLLGEGLHLAELTALYKPVFRRYYGGLAVGTAPATLHTRP